MRRRRLPRPSAAGPTRSTDPDCSKSIRPTMISAGCMTSARLATTRVSHLHRWTTSACPMPHLAASATAPLQARCSGCPCSWPAPHLSTVVIWSTVSSPPTATCRRRSGSMTQWPPRKPPTATLLAGTSRPRLRGRLPRRRRRCRRHPVLPPARTPTSFAMRESARITNQQSWETARRPAACASRRPRRPLRHHQVHRRASTPTIFASR